MKRIMLRVLATAFAASLAACSMMKDEAPAPTSGTIEENAVMVTARVTKIDHTSRMVTLTTNEGKEITFEAGPEIRNLDQVQAGDVVRAQYFESVVYEVRRPGEAVPGVRVAEDVAKAPLGSRPAAGAARAVVVTATVEAIDMNAPSVTLRTPSGEVTTLPVRDPNRLRAVKTGDLVEFTFTQAVAISVEEIQN